MSDCLVPLEMAEMDENAGDVGNLLWPVAGAPDIRNVAMSMLTLKRAANDWPSTDGWPLDVTCDEPMHEDSKGAHLQDACAPKHVDASAIDLSVLCSLSYLRDSDDGLNMSSSSSSSEDDDGSPLPSDDDGESDVPLPFRAKRARTDDEDSDFMERVKKRSTILPCKHPGCTKGARSRGLCKRHGGGKRCSVDDCARSDQGGGFCIKHGGGRRCAVEDCKNSSQSRGLCKRHGGIRPRRRNPS
ncbi:hypothetical protein SPRG_04964 [Saprolegnia parasitica CBS 223.65]|uniref:WRKY19-like zinc finger domain-containing protein n=1 Tax=Saprolegnia parasitica (strain CBS 223.65) TaxID=695850 RepID=A0A067CHB3_SAPPC|nr:hypothetical protein SPRG_04964 [Saprolegnia parasitica CBS 223.65]KDO29898.1 hypothetical protein SPRG_04964 [Saprolegnia parasitica CBS 223.65]|eukprot:XP_012199492.1 hypothetical protein SPRG_04964 [Saprolegnia parasitica CBS 223.65]